MKVVLFCGGQGMRLRDYSEKVPKPMVPVGPRPILWHVMKYYAQYGHNEFILALGHHSEPIKRFFLTYDEAVSNDFIMRNGGSDIEMLGSDIDDWTVTFVDTGLNATIGERLKRVRPYLEGEEMFLANYADGVTDLDLNAYVDRFSASGKTAALLAVKPPQSYHVVRTDEDGVPTGIGPIARTDLWLNGGFFVMRSRFLEYLDHHSTLVEDGAFDQLVEEGELYVERFGGWWSPMDTFKDKQYLDSIWSTGEVPWLQDMNGH